ncbi:MAG: hypothetical protein CL916_08990 [Deltaproteobacteria bacterium]|nr:hypothetical protein [Deltaproteobacteria bacterium]
MKSISSIIFIIVAAAVAVMGWFVTQYSSIQKTTQDNIMIIAHRGSSSTAPDNSLISIEQALISNADFVEIDIHLTNDGYFVVLHDHIIEEKIIIEQSLETIQSFDISMPDKFSESYKEQQSPDLERALELILTKSTPLIEYKRNPQDPEKHARRASKKLLQLLDNRGWGKKVMIQSFDVQFLAYCRAMNPDIMLGWLIMDELVVHLETIEQEINPEIVAWKRENLTKENINWIRERSDAQIWSWYGREDKINDPAFTLDMIQHGITGIITDYPAQAYVVREWYQSQ